MSDLIKLYVVTFFIILSSLFTCVVYRVSGDMNSFPALSNRAKVILVLAAFAITFTMLVLATSAGVHKSIKRTVYFILMIFVFISLCFIFINCLRPFGIRINMFKATIYVAAFYACLYSYGYINRFIIRPTYYDIATEKNINMKVAFVSDIHMGAIGTSARLLKKIVNVINENKPDLVLFGGDIVESKLDYFNSSEYAEILRGIKSRLGTKVILGNHEHYTGSLVKIMNFLTEKCGMHLLLDEFLEIDSSMILIGRKDGGHNRTRIRKGLADITKGINISNKFLLVLDHNPKYFDEVVASGVDLQLSGHTHNGQLFPFNLFIKFFYEKPYGKLVKQNSTLLVSSGAGTWGPPVKVFSKPEVVVVNINHIKKSKEN
ncbi:phosphohydrolase [Bacilli bacterium]|nr:phosphohydrolase [Bacilli bacterium]